MGRVLEDDALPLLLRRFRDVFRSSSHFSARAFIDGHPATAPTDVDRLLPSSEERTLSCYSKRVCAEYGRFALILNGFANVDGDLAERCAAIAAMLAPLDARRLGATSALFLGNSGCSPLATHQDVGHRTLQLPLLGQRTFRFWPPESRPLDGGDQPPADERVVGPGQVVFWDGRYWHLVRSEPGELSAALTVSFFSEKPTSRQAFLKKAVAAHCREAVATIEPPKAGRATRAYAHAVAAEVGATLAARTESINTEAWLSEARVATAHGFLTPIVPRPPRPVANGDLRVRGDRLRWQIHDDQVVVVAAGRTFEMSARRTTIEFLEILSARDILSGDLGRSDEEAAILSFLYQSWVLDPC